MDQIIGLVAPHECIACGKEGALVCKPDLMELASPKRSSCFLCNKLTENWRVCQSCRHKTKARGVIIASHYEGSVKQLVRLLKYQRTVSAATILASLLTPNLTERQFDLITAVPASSRRYRSRGYNQADLIAKSMARQLRLPYSQSLGRLGQTRQVGTSRRQRIKQAEGTMYTNQKWKVAGQNILVVDDVVTTGATISEATRALKAAGAKSVWGAAVAKH